MSLNVVILAAGKGTRMRSSLPKVLHPVANKPMVSHVIDTARQVGAEQLHLVYGHGAELGPVTPSPKLSRSGRMKTMCWCCTAIPR